MGMTIDEIIQGIEVIKAQAEWDYPLDWQIVLDGAIDTMRKYQKIEQILKDVPYGGEATVRRIQEVVKDGNDTTNTGSN